MQGETPLTWDDVDFLREGPSDPLDLAWAIIERRQPRWLMGWRDICRSTDQRTVIGAAFSKVGVGNNLPVLHLGQPIGARGGGFIRVMCESLILDFAARHKVGGTHPNFFIAQQLPVLPPSDFKETDLDFFTLQVLELTYTSHAMRPWAEDLGHHGPPFASDEERRAQLRAELDAFFAMKYGLRREELVYVLDPAKAKGPDYPSETFRVLQKNEIARFGEYCTERPVLAAFRPADGALRCCSRPSSASASTRRRSTRASASAAPKRATGSPTRAWAHLRGNPPDRRARGLHCGGRSQRRRRRPQRPLAALGGQSARRFHCFRRARYGAAARAGARDVVPRPRAALAPLREFGKKTCGLPRTTEAERLVVQRVGQDVFRGCAPGLLGQALRDHRRRRAPAPAREPHQAVGTVRDRRGATRRLQRPAAGLLFLARGRRCRPGF